MATLPFMESREHQMIKSLAYCFYLHDGCPEGSAFQHWLEAEQLVQGEEQFEAEASFEPNILSDEPVKEPELSGLFVEIRCF
jgi:hypothetical protein